MGFIRKSTHLVLVLAALVAFAAQAGFNGVLNTPAMPTRLAAQKPLNCVVVAGSRLVAAGHRGHIVYSDDQGNSWTQAAVPVSSDLTAVFFGSARTGWAVGHDGVVLRSDDGGQSWQLQLDGNRAETLIKDYYGKKAEAGDTLAAELLPEIERDFSSGADKPFLDVWFANDREGFVVGAFNMIFRTADGGETWVPWYERVENPRRLHLYSIRGAGSRVYLAGELGFIARLDNGAERFAAIPSPYEGSFFGVLPIGDGAVVYGMRGHAFRIDRDGTNWRKLETGIVGGITAAAGLGDDRLALVSTAGDILVGSADTGEFHKLKAPREMMFAGVACVRASRLLASVGNGGALMVPLAPKR